MGPHPAVLAERGAHGPRPAGHNARHHHAGDHGRLLGGALVVDHRRHHQPGQPDRRHLGDLHDHDAPLERLGESGQLDLALVVLELASEGVTPVGRKREARKFTGIPTLAVRNARQQQALATSHHGSLSSRAICRGRSAGAIP